MSKSSQNKFDKRSLGKIIEKRKKLWLLDYMKYFGIYVEKSRYLSVNFRLLPNFFYFSDFFLTKTVTTLFFLLNI